MARYVLVVHAQHVEGREEEFTEWYDNVHIPAVLEFDGFVSAQRYRLVDAPTPRNEDRKTMVIYEIETDDLEAMSARARGAKLPVTEAIQQSLSTVAHFAPVGDVQFAPKK